MTMTNKDKLLSYFKNFSNKDIDSLKKMFSEDVRLIDWEIAESGIDDVTKANQKIFGSVDSIIAKPISIYQDGEDSFAVEILIVVNEKEFLEVVDVIQFDEDGLINSIKAYKK
jgi:hypothetical protein